LKKEYINSEIQTPNLLGREGKVNRRLRLHCYNLSQKNQDITAKK
jgi:hypothetical protein